ncbi:MAG TPA: glycine cleavage system aminomethyltransferase GcvT [Patescibacteria group bacterium]|jgi:aminomethyltransferase|nr:glycine cleavage system aminomethyltransferase GcvT [Patescibacteria group bacterium]
MKRTPLYDIHLKSGAKLIEFGGWEMPVQYTSIVDEHLAVRKAAGLFDISHMGEFFVGGRAAESFLNGVLTNDVRKLSVGLGQYTLCCNENGGVIDDLYVYRLGADQYLLIVNASRIDADFHWLENQLETFGQREQVTLRNASENTGAIAVQGPRVAEFIDACFSGSSKGGIAVSKPSELHKNQIAQFGFDGQPVWVSRTGYTGEDGFEIVAPAALISSVWRTIQDKGKSYGLKLAGLGARDTLRTEVCYPLYGHELDEETTPIEAGLGFFVALDKGDFMGRARLADQKANGVKKKLVAFKMTEKSAPPRPHYAIWAADPAENKIGEVVTGTQSPTLGVGLGLGYVPPELAKPQKSIQIEIRGKRAPAMIVAKPFYRKAG